MDSYEPPFTVTNSIINLVVEISSELTEIRLLSHGNISPKLRRTNQVRTIHSSLAIEQNTLSLEQVTAIIEGHRILGNPIEIQEVKNAFNAYQYSLKFNPLSVKDLLKAHGTMMEKLISDNGRFRSGNVGVFAGKTVVHVAPPAHLVPEEVQDLFEWYRNSEMHPLIKSCIFHYEFEFIHPFSDGNGRLGRLWHSLLLGTWNEVFHWLPVEDLIRERQQEYYEALASSDKVADSQYFVEFMLQVIADSLRNIKVIVTPQEAATGILPEHYMKLMDVLGLKELSLSEMMDSLNLKHKTNFRKNYIVPALQDGIIEMTLPDKPTSKYQKYRLTTKYRMRLNE